MDKAWYQDHDQEAVVAAHLQSPWTDPSRMMLKIPGQEALYGPRPIPMLLLEDLHSFFL